MNYFDFQQISNLQIQIDRLKREKELYLEEIVALKAKNEELNRLLTSVSSGSSKEHKTPSKLQKIAKYPLINNEKSHFFLSLIGIDLA